MKYVCGIEIGSSKVAGCLGSFRGRELVNLWWDSLPVSGIEQGNIQEARGLTSALSALLKKLEAKSAIKVKSVYLGILNRSITAKHSKAVIALAERGSRAVIERDVREVIQQAEILGACLEEEIIESLPFSYAIDNENEIAYPLGLYGHQLKVDLYLLSAKSAYINVINEIINCLGLRLNGITLSGLAAVHSVFDADKIKGLNVFCDIGKDITQVLFFKDEKLAHFQLLDIGGDDLTLSLSQELKLPYALAEEVKIAYGRILIGDAALKAEQIPEREIIIKSGSDYSTLSQCSIITALTRASWQIAEKIAGALKPQLLAINSPNKFPEKVSLYIAGRTACLEGFLETIEVALNLPVKLAKINNPALVAPLMRRQLLSQSVVLNYLAPFGLIAEVIKPAYCSPVSSGEPGNLLVTAARRIRALYQEYF